MFPIDRNTDALENQEAYKQVSKSGETFVNLSTGVTEAAVKLLSGQNRNIDLSGSRSTGPVARFARTETWSIAMAAKHGPYGYRRNAGASKEDTLGSIALAIHWGAKSMVPCKLALIDKPKQTENRAFWRTFRNLRAWFAILREIRDNAG